MMEDQQKSLQPSEFHSFFRKVVSLINLLTNLEREYQSSVTSRAFRDLATQVHTLRAAYLILDPYVHRSRDFLTEAGLTLSCMIYHDVDNICVCLTDDLSGCARTLARLPPSSQDSEARRRRKDYLRRFIEDRGNYDLEILQLHYASSILQLMLAVFT
jgi:hypothetical protein